MEKEKILEINHMKISFCQYQKGMHQTELPVISDLNVTVRAGEMVAIVGSSGSGKSLLAHGILGILPYNASMKGGIQYCGEPLTEKKIRKLRGKEIVLVPQSTSYLDPLMKVGQQICKGKKDPEKKGKLDRIFEKYSLDKKVQEQYPFELSGGMTRRIMISTALIETPKLVIADEPTPGLDPKLARRAMEQYSSLPMIWNWHLRQQTGFRCFMQDIRLKMQWQRILRRKKPCGIPIQKRCGGLCRRMDFITLTGYSRMPETGNRDVRLLHDVRNVRTDVRRKRFHGGWQETAM